MRWGDLIELSLAARMALTGGKRFEVESKGLGCLLEKSRGWGEEDGLPPNRHDMCAADVATST